MTFTANPSCIGTFNAASAFGISTHTPFEFAPAIDCYTQAAGSGLFNVFAAPQNSLFPSTRPFSLTSDQKLLEKASHIGLHVLSPLKPPTFTPLHAHAFVAGASEYFAAPDGPTEKLEAASNGTKDLSHWIEDLSVPDMVVRCDAIKALEEIVHHLDPKDLLELALKIAERIDDVEADVREAAIKMFVKIVPLLDPADRLKVDQKIAESLGGGNVCVPETAVWAFEALVSMLKTRKADLWAPPFSQHQITAVANAYVLAISANEYNEPPEAIANGAPPKEVFNFFFRKLVLLNIMDRETEQKFRKIASDMDSAAFIKFVYRIIIKSPEYPGISETTTRKEIMLLVNIVSHFVPLLDFSDRLEFVVLFTHLLNRFSKGDGRLKHFGHYDVYGEGYRALENMVLHLDAGDRLKLAYEIAKGTFYYKILSEDSVQQLKKIVPHLDADGRRELVPEIFRLVDSSAACCSSDPRKKAAAEEGFKNAIEVLGNIAFHMDAGNQQKLVFEFVSSPYMSHNRWPRWALDNIVSNIDASGNLREFDLKIAEEGVKEIKRILAGNAPSRSFEAFLELLDVVSTLDPTDYIKLAQVIVPLLKYKDRNVRATAASMLAKIVPSLNSSDRLGPTLKIVERLDYEREHPGRLRLFYALKHIAPHLEPADARKVAFKIEECTWSHEPEGLGLYRLLGFQNRR